MNEIPRRLLQGCISLFLLITAVFFLIRLVPGDPAVLIAGPGASAEAIERIREQQGLDRPLILQYASFLEKAVRGDLGISSRTQRPVVEEIAQRLPNTAALALTGILTAGALGIGAGIAAALRRNTLIDILLTAIAVLAISVPAFWLAVILIDNFSVRLGWLPVYGASTPWHFVLPSIVIASSQVGLIMRVTRSAMIDSLTAEFITTARAKGVPPRRLVAIHALRNALVPIITVVFLQMGVLVSGAVVTESIFNWPGVGRFLIDSVTIRDYPSVQGLVLTFGIIFIVINLASDLVNTLIDPRLRRK